MTLSTSDAGWMSTMRHYASRWRSTTLWAGTAYSAMYLTSACLQHTAVARRYRYLFLTSLLFGAARRAQYDDDVASIATSAESLKKDLKTLSVLLAQCGKHDCDQEALLAQLADMQTQGRQHFAEIEMLVRTLQDILSGEQWEQRKQELCNIEARIQRTLDELQQTKGELQGVRESLQTLRSEFHGEVALHARNNAEQAQHIHQLSSLVQRLQHIVANVLPTRENAYMLGSSLTRFVRRIIF